VPVVDASKPEGYTFEGVPQLDWETKRLRQALDSLVRKGYFKAELMDKVIVCIACGSANVRIKKLCPECMSMRLRKEALIEHFSCGAVDRQAAFETENGDLVCPKCKAMLQLIGSDYRVLPPAYLCLVCNVRRSDPLLVVECEDCGSTAQLDEEPEVFLYKYTVNSSC
jgi:Zn finger protein HypA/HybF involved in hydrogenase expression